MPVSSITLKHREGSDSPESKATLDKLRNAGVEAADIEALTCYLLEGELDEQATTLAASLLVDAVLETPTITKDKIPAPSKGTQISVLKRGGVMDPVENSVIRALTAADIHVQAVKCVRLYRTPSELDQTTIQNFSKALANDVVEECRIGDVDLDTLRIDTAYDFKRIEVPYNDLDDNGLQEINSRHSLSMNIEELRAVQAFFKGKGREPTDIELEMLAQTWSEHCKHKTLTGPVVYSEDGKVQDSLFGLLPQIFPKDGKVSGLLQSTIKRATTELDRSFCWSVFVDNAGIIEFDETQGVCIKVETHNHPSAIEPYGGAGTGIGGVIRDILGTGLGAKPILNTDVFCVGHLDMDVNEVPKGALHPRTTLRGVVSGVRDYGNRMGIPTTNGALLFDERYTGNPLVYAGCVGIMPREAVVKAARPGDAIVVIGGRTGRDGIGGATFSSVELTEESEVVSSGAVQIGNAIQEKTVLDVLIKTRDENLYNDLTDCGAGGLSSAVGEMGEKCGADVELSGVPLKYQGLSYREIWLSEAQERLVFGVPEAKLDRFLEVCHAQDVETAVIGRFRDDQQMIVKYDGEVVLDVPMDFLHDGLPLVERKADWQTPAPQANTRATASPENYGSVLRSILASPNVASKEWVIRQYDHEVQAMSAIKPMSGIHCDGPSDGCAVVPNPESEKAVVVGCGINPHFGDIDPYWMAQAVIDEALRNVACCGGDVNHTAILDNFSWGNCDKPDRLGSLARACAGCYVAAKGLGTPFISGKDSLNNEFATEEGTIAIPPTLLITAMSVSSLERLTTMDLKQAGNVIYQIGLSADEFGGSHFNIVTGENAGNVPIYNPEEALSCYQALNRAQSAGIIRAAHDCSEGGLAVAIAEMAFAGGLGANLELSTKLAKDSPAENDRSLLFSESNARILLEVTSSDAAQLEEIFAGLPLTRIGEVTQGPQLSIKGLSGDEIIGENIEELRRVWKTPLYAAMGEQGMAED